MNTINRQQLAAALSVALLSFAAEDADAQPSPAPAAQQDASAASAQNAQAPTVQAETKLDTVTVTGSRIPRAGFDTLEPATMIGEIYVESRGITNVADALNEIPGFGQGASPEGGQSNFGVGANYLDRFDLGSQRTLTLINGRRVVSSNAPTTTAPVGGGGQVDLNIIPTQLIDRVENLSVGGAPTYGSDAVTGVVNIILKSDYEGVEVQTTYGITERGDGERYNGSVLFGQNFADNRGNITLAASIDRQDGVLQAERDYFADACTLQTNPDASLIAMLQPGRTPANDGRVLANIPFNTGNNDGIPNSVTICNTRAMNFTAGGLLLQPTGSVNFPDGRLRGFGANEDVYLQFATNGNLVPYDPGINFGNTRASGGDGFNQVQDDQLTSDLERKALYAIGHFNFTDRVSVFFELNHYDGESLELLGDPVSNISSSPQPDGTITIGSDHPLLNEQARATLAENGISSFQLSRASTEFTTTGTRSESKLTRGVIGLRGDFDFADRKYNWEISVNRGQQDSIFFDTALNQQNFVNAINVTRDAAGNVVCSPVNVPWVIYRTAEGSQFQPIADPNCVPLDLFGEGAPSAQAVDYVTDPTRARAELRQQVYNANITGNPFDIWGGPLGFNIGYEHRKESASFVPDDFQQQGLGRAAPVAPVTGEFSTDEIFAETLLPLIDSSADLPFLKQLDLTAKVRWVDNTVNGLFTTWTYGLQWRPFDDLEIRANKTRSFRAPAIVELFTPTTELSLTVPDACDSRNITGGPQPALRQANCQAFFEQFGISEPFTSNAVNSSIRGTTSGDPNLDNEDADSYAVGFVWQPSFIEGLEVAVDYTQVELNHVIDHLGANEIVEGCFDNPDFATSDVTQANPFCSRITRDQNGQIIDISTGFINGESFDVNSFSAVVSYNLDLADYGVFNINFTTAHLKQLQRSENGITTNVFDGDVSHAQNQHQLNLGYQQDRFGFNLQVAYLSSSDIDINATIETRDITTVDSYWLHNASVSYRLGASSVLRLAVSNIFDEDPPFPTGLNGSTHDLLGRRYALTAEWKF